MRKGYSEYKNSGVTWLGDVPTHWEVMSIKMTTPVQRGASPRPIDDPIYFDDEGEYAWVRISDVTAAGMYLHSTEQRLSAIGSSLSVKLDPESLFLSIAGSVGKACINKIKCCIHDGFVYFPKWNGDQKFLYYIFASGEPYKGLGKLGTQLNLNTDTVGGIKIGLPPKDEQKKIAEYLDGETSKIDSLIAKKKEFIERLKEKRTALISQVVTKGLPPEEAKKHGLPVNPKMKDSGYKWIGETNFDWIVHPLKRIVSTRITDGPHETPEIFDDGIPFVSAEAVENGSINFNKVRGYISEVDDLRFSKKCKPKRNDIFLVKSGSTTGKIAIVESDVNFNIWSPIALIRVKDLFYPRFVFYALNSEYFQNQIRLFWSFGTQPNIGMGVIENLRIAVPQSVEEQRVIADYLDVRTSEIEILTEKTRRAIALLTEYRSSLITSAVTGKIDVREAVK